MTRRRITRTVIAGGALGALALGGASIASPAVAAHNSNLKMAHLHPLNNSGTMGSASVRIGTTT